MSVSVRSLDIDIENDELEMLYTVISKCSEYERPADLQRGQITETIQPLQESRHSKIEKMIPLSCPYSPVLIERPFEAHHCATMALP